MQTDAVVLVVPSGPNTEASQSRSSSEGTRHTQQVLSPDAEHSRRWEGWKQTELTEPLWPTSDAISRPLSADQMRAVRSALALAMIVSLDSFTQGQTAMCQTPSLCPLNCLCSDHSTFPACVRRTRVTATDECRTRSTALETSRWPRCRILSRMRCLCTRLVETGTDPGLDDVGRPGPATRVPRCASAFDGRESRAATSAPSRMLLMLLVRCST